MRADVTWIFVQISNKHVSKTLSNNVILFKKIFFTSKLVHLLFFSLVRRKDWLQVDDKLQSTLLTTVKQLVIKLSTTISNSNERHKSPKETFLAFASPGYFRFSSRQRQIAICIRKQCIQTSLRLGGRACRFLLSRWLPILPTSPFLSSHSSAFPFRDEYSYYQITRFTNDVARIYYFFFSFF